MHGEIPFALMSTPTTEVRVLNKFLLPSATANVNGVWFAAPGTSHKKYVLLLFHVKNVFFGNKTQQ